MEYEVINSLACCIDNVYGNIAEDASRKTIAKLVDIFKPEKISKRTNKKKD